MGVKKNVNHSRLLCDVVKAFTMESCFFDRVFVMRDFRRKVRNCLIHWLTVIRAIHNVITGLVKDSSTGSPDNESSCVKFLRVA